MVRKKNPRAITKISDETEKYFFGQTSVPKKFFDEWGNLKTAEYLRYEKEKQVNLGNQEEALSIIKNNKNNKEKFLNTKEFEKLNEIF